MDRSAFKTSLVGGYIEHYTINLTSKTVELEVHVLERGVLSRYDVLFAEVSYLAFEDAKSNPWERIELSDLWIDYGPEQSRTEEWEVTLSLWDVAKLNIRAAILSIDGERLR